MTCSKGDRLLESDFDTIQEKIVAEILQITKNETRYLIPFEENLGCL